VRLLVRLAVAREGAHGLVAGNRAAVARLDELFLQSFVHAERDLAKADLIERDVGDEASPHQDQRNEDDADAQEESNESSAQRRQFEGKRWLKARRRRGRFEHRFWSSSIGRFGKIVRAPWERSAAGPAAGPPAARWRVATGRRAAGATSQLLHP